MSVYSFFDTSFGAMWARLRAAASNFLVSLWEDRSGNTDLRPLYARPGAEMVREEWTEWRGRGIRPVTRNFDDRWDL